MFLLGTLGGVLGFGVLASPWALPSSPQSLDRTAALRALDHELLLAEAMRVLPPIERAFVSFAWGRTAESSLCLAQQTNTELLDELPRSSSPRDLRERDLIAGNLVVILMDQDDHHRAMELLETLQSVEIARALRAAYFGPPLEIHSADLRLLLPTEAARYVAELRSAERRGDHVTVDDVGSRLRHRAGLYLRPIGLGRLLALLGIAGSVLLLMTKGRGVVIYRGPLSQAAPWGVREGLCTFGLLLSVLAISAIARLAFGSHPYLTVSSALLVPAATIALLASGLQRSVGTLLTTPVGIEGTARGARHLLGWSGVLVALDLAGQGALRSLLAASGATRTWVEPIDVYWISAPSLVIGLEGLQLWIITPLIEEITFRGVLLPTLQRATGATIAVFGSAILFAVLHPGIEEATSALCLGIVLGVGYYRRGSLVPVVICHSLHNLFPVLDVILRYR